MANTLGHYPETLSVRNLPINLSPKDLALFEHELKKVIPETKLITLESVKVNQDGIIYRGNKILPESFVFADQLNTWEGRKIQLKFLLKNYFSKYKSISVQEAFWFTDTWDTQYFHWMTDALPRLLVIRELASDATVLLPKPYTSFEYVRSSLMPFELKDLRFIDEVASCQTLKMPTLTAPTGNFNETIVQQLRALFANYYKNSPVLQTGSRIYISRSKAQKRKITNESAVIEVLKDYGFEVICFEDYPFEQQVQITLKAQYLVSNHGAGLTNILFMASGSRVLELRRAGDALNNCYFALASALNLQYFYQLCDAENPDEDPHTANLIVDCQQLRTTLDCMFSS